MSLQVSSDVAFTPAVKSVQARRGSRDAFAKVEARGGFRTAITPDLVAVSLRGRYRLSGHRHRTRSAIRAAPGRSEGFIRLVDDTTLGFADFAGNRQYVTTGNLAENDRAFLFLMDYAHRRRIKLWGRARVVDDDPALIAQLMPEGYRARPEQAILFRVEAWDVNCSQHIPQKIDADEVAGALASLQQKVAALEAENARLHAQLAVLGRETRD